MTDIPKPIEVMQSLLTYINDAYALSGIKLNGVIQLNLIYNGMTENYIIDVKEEKLTLSEGIYDNPTVTLKSTLYDFLDLASGKLNPIIGVMLRKLKFSGDIKFFKKIMKQKEIFSAGTDWKSFKDPVSQFEKNPFNPWVKPKSVLIINGSPRAKKGYTDFYSQEFKKGLESACDNVELVYLSKFKINDCIGCLKCMLDTSGDCIHDGKDEFKIIYEKQLKADLVIFAFPLYLDGMPGLLKNYIDRTVRSDHIFKIEGPSKLRHARKNMKDQTMMAFSICGYLEKENFKPVKEHIKQLAGTKHMPLLTSIYRSASIYIYHNPLVYKKLNIIMEAMKKAGEEIILNGKITNTTMKKIEMDIDKPSTFLKIANTFFDKKIANNERNY